MRRSDILFFGMIILSLIVLWVSLIFEIDSNWIAWWWLVPLAPVAFAKSFFPKSKFVAWWGVALWKPKE